MGDGRSRKPPRVSRPPLPRALAQRKLRVGLPPTVARRQPASPAAKEKAAAPPARRTDTPKVAAPPPVAAPVAPPRTEAAVPHTPAAANALLLRGGYWELRFGGHSTIVEDCRGLRYIALLIQQAGGD